MDFKIKVSPIAISNVRDAVSFYKNVTSVRIAQKFVNDYEDTLRIIKQNPHFQIYYKDIRGLPLKKYP